MPDASLVAARAVAYGALLLAAGLPLYLLTTGRGIALTRRTRRALALLGVLAAIASLWWALASIAAMTALPIAQLDGATTEAVMAATPLGAVLLARFAALALLLLAVALRPTPGLTALPAAVALATAAWTGHAGATEGVVGDVHRVGDIVHLLVAATWLGALVMLLAGALGSTPARELERRLAGFAAVGTLVVALLLLTGIGNTLLIAPWPLPLASTWTVLLGIKIALFGVMLGFAALNRWRLTPGLAAGSGAARGHLRRSLLGETLLAFAVIAIVAALGVLDPAA